jgi:hypothetical protein
VKRIFIPLLGVFLFWGCENPYMVHNLIRPVTATAIEFTTDRDETPAPLKPVFSKTVTSYTVLVHEYAEKVYPNAIPETGSSIVFGGSRYIQGGEEKEIPWNGVYYPFPDDIGEMETGFTVYKDYRIEGQYTVRIQRKPDAGRVQDLAVTAGFYDNSIPGAVDKTNPGDPGWGYEAVLPFGFNSAGTKFDVKLFYNTEKVLIEPAASPGIIFAYTLYSKDPAYYPDVRTRIDFGNTSTPQIFDFSSTYNLTGDAVGAGAPEVDQVTGKKTAYLMVHTVSQDPDTGEQRYPQDYLLKLVWEKEYAYLNELHINDDISPADERILGNFYRANTGYDAEVNAAAGTITVSAVPRDAGSNITIEKWSSMVNGTRLAGPVTASSTSFPFPGAGPNPEFSCALRITVNNPVLFPDPETNHGEISYWIDVRREQPMAKLKNIKLTGFVDTDGSPLSPPVEQDLFWFDNNNDETGPDIHATAWSALKEPAQPDPPANAPFDLENENSFIMELDGVKISKLRLTGIAETPECSVTYKVGNNPPRTDPPGVNNYYEFTFEGGTGASITVSRPNHKDRVYAFTFIRTGAMIIELYTDKRDPPPAAGMPPDNRKIINDSERGTFQSVAGSGRPVNSVLPGQQVTLQVTPRLGWKVHELYLIGDDGVTLTPWSGAGLPSQTGPVPNPPAETGMTEWKFNMPDRKLNFLLQYDFVTNAVPGVAYVAPEGKAGRSGAYGTAANGTGSGDTGTCWAYATSNLQGVIDKFDGSSFKEIWLLEGTYYLDPNKDPAKDWAEAITDRGDEKNRSFVLKQGIRIYGGYKGTENARISHSDGDLTAARKTILSGRLRDSRNVRHVVIAANIAAPPGQPPAARSDFSSPAGYGFAPDFDPSTNTGLTLLDTLTIRDGLRTKDTGTVQVYARNVKNANGAGFYNVDASPYLRNVIISNNTGVMGGGMYNEETSGNTSAPVLQNVSFDNNDATGFTDKGGDGAGFANAGGMPVFLNCQFTNNSTVGGNGAGLHVGGGSALLRGCEFKYNHAGGAGGALANFGTTWIYGTNTVGINGRPAAASNSAVDGAAGIYQGGTLYLVNVTLNNAVSNSGTLSGTNVTMNAGLSSGGALALVNSTINGGLGVSQGPTALANVVFSGGSLNYSVNHGEKDPGPDRLGGVILTNVTFKGGAGISAAYANQYAFHHGAANLLLNSVRLGGSGVLSVNSSGTAYPDGRSGVYVTMNNVTAAGSGQALTTNAKNIAVPASGNAHDVLDLRIRNSVVMGDAGIITSDGWPVIGTFASGGSLGSGSVTLRREKAALLSPGDSFRVLRTDQNRTPRPALYSVDAVNTSTGVVSFTPAYPGSSPDYSYLANETMALAPNWTSLGTVGSAGTLSPGAAVTLSVSSAQKALLPLHTVFKISPTPVEGASGTLVCKVTGVDPVLNEVTVTVSGTGSQNYNAGDHIMLNSGRASLGPIGARFMTGTGANTWTHQAAAGILNLLLPADQKFRIAAGGKLTPSEYTVTAISGDDVTFTAVVRDTYTAADRIMIANGTVGSANGGGTLDTTPGGNTWTVTDEQAALFAVDTKFRIVDGTGTIGTSVNTVTDRIPNDPGPGTTITFTATSADSYAAADGIMIDSGAIANLPSKNITAGGNSIFLDPLSPAQAAILDGKTFRIAAGSAAGTIKAPVCTVTGVNTATGEITFTSSGGGAICGPSDYIVFPSVKYADLKGNILWDHSMARGAERAPGSPSFISGAGKTKTGVFNSTNDDGGYRVTDSALKDRGDSSLYPAAVPELLDQCFEQYDANGGTTTGMRSSLTTLLGKLYTWSGIPEAGYLSLADISTFLSKDNGYNRGDLRTPQPDGGEENRKNGVIDVGAYEN